MSIQFKQKAKQGFTLVELSIVIVIIGFLVAGIAAGANMVKQAQIRSVILDLQSYQTAYNNFKAKYNKIPGDMENATAFWPNNGQCVADVVTEADLCNGNGDGRVVASLDEEDEVHSALKHLSLANMISAGIPVIPTPTPDVPPLVPGVNAPSSKISGAGYMLVSGRAAMRGANYVIPGNGEGFDGSDRTVVVYIGKSTADLPSFPGPDNLLNGALQSEEAFGIDQKIDDGTVNGIDFTGATTGNVRTADSLDGTGECVVALSTNNYVINTSTTSCFLGLALN